MDTVNSAEPVSTPIGGINQELKNYKNKSSLLLSAIIIVLILVVFILIAIIVIGRNKTVNVISSYEECVAAGNPILESFPPQCKTPDGQSFTQKIGGGMAE